MTGQGEPGTDLAGLVVPLAGQLVATGDLWEPYRLVDADGAVVDSVGVYFGHLQAAGRAELTVRSYGMDLLRWFRFLWAVGVAWDRATRSEGRDFCRWLLLAGKPVRPHWRERDRPGVAAPVLVSGEVYAPSVRAHSETVLRGFYDFHREAGTGPLVNPFPWTARAAAGARMRTTIRWSLSTRSAAACTLSAIPSRIPRSVPDAEFNEIFAALHSHRDRALVAFYVSTGARASELLSATRGGTDPGRQLITVVRKGTRELQQLPARTDAFVWLRLYQLEMDGKLPRGSGQPLWWTLRRPLRPLGYHAAHRMFERAGAVAGTGATLHSLRHTAAYRMAEDPDLPLTDVQLVLGHALLTTTQLYLTPRKEDVIRRILAHHENAGPPGPAAGQAGDGAGLPTREPCCAVREPDLVTAVEHLNACPQKSVWLSGDQGQRGPGSRRDRRRPGGLRPRRPGTRWPNGWPASCQAAPPWLGGAAGLAGGAGRRQLSAALAGQRRRYCPAAWWQLPCVGPPAWSLSRRWPRWSRPCSPRSAPTSSGCRCRGSQPAGAITASWPAS